MTPNPASPATPPRVDAPSAPRLGGEEGHRAADPDQAALVQRMFGRIAGRYDLVNLVLSGGLDRYWRARAAAQVAAWAPGRLLDLAVGSGALARTIVGRCPRTQVVGADFCPPMLRLARARRGLRALVAADGLRLPFAAGSFDAVTVAFGLRNMVSWSGALAEMRRVLRPGGRLLVLDFSLPPAGWRRAGYRFYLHRFLPWIAGAVCGERGAYEYLGGSIEEFPHGAEMLALMTGQGFGRAAAQPLTGGVVSIYTAERGEARTGA